MQPCFSLYMNGNTTSTILIIYNNALRIGKSNITILHAVFNQF